MSRHSAHGRFDFMHEEWVCGKGSWPRHKRRPAADEEEFTAIARADRLQQERDRLRLELDRVLQERNILRQELTARHAGQPQKGFVGLPEDGV